MSWLLRAMVKTGGKGRSPQDGSEDCHAAGPSAGEMTGSQAKGEGTECEGAGGGGGEERRGKGEKGREEQGGRRGEHPRAARHVPGSAGSRRKSREVSFRKGQVGTKCRHQVGGHAPTGQRCDRDPRSDRSGLGSARLGSARPSPAQPGSALNYQLSTLNYQPSTLSSRDSGTRTSPLSHGGGPPPLGDPRQAY